MAFVGIDISSGYAPDTDVSSDGASAVTNWRLVDAIQDGRSRISLPRPGTTAYAVTGLSAAVIGAYRYQNARQTIVVTSDRYIYRVADSAPTVATPLSTSTASTQLGGTLRPTFAEDSSGVLIAGGGYISKWSPGSATAAQITAGSAPVHSTHLAVLGQRVISTDTTNPVNQGGFLWSDLGAGNDTSWQALSFATADARTDPVVAIYDNTSELFVFGATTLQVYSISSDALSPYAPAVTSNAGLIAPYSVVRIDNQFAFINENRSVVMSDGRQVQDITGPIQSEIRALGTVSDAWGWRERHDRWDLLCFHFPTAMRTYELDLKRNTWSVRAKYDPAQGINVDMPIGAYSYNEAQNRHVFWRSDASTGGFYLDSANTVDYDGAAILCERLTGWNDYGSTNRKRSKVIRAYLKTGTATSAPGAIEVSVSDDGRPWSNWVQMSIGQPSSTTQMWADAYLGGVFVRRRCRWRYATSATEAAALVSAADDVTDLGR